MPLLLLTVRDTVHPVPDTELKFEKGDARPDELQAAVDGILAELRDPDSEAAAEAVRAGIDPNEAAEAQLTVREEAQGIDPVTAAILVGVATNLASHVVEKLWDDVFWPLVKRRIGAKAVGRKVK